MQKFRIAPFLPLQGHASQGLGAQFSLISSATMLVTPVMVTGSLLQRRIVRARLPKLEVIGGGDAMNIEDRARQLQQHGADAVVENEISHQLLVPHTHQQLRGAGVIMVRVDPPGA
jgi:hypothetical protein